MMSFQGRKNKVLFTTFLIIIPLTGKAVVKMMKTGITRGLAVEVTQQRGEEHGLWARLPGLKPNCLSSCASDSSSVKLLLSWVLLL